MNVELRTEDETTIGLGSLTAEIITILLPGDTVSFFDDTVDVIGRFMYVRKHIIVRHGNGYLPDIVIYVREIDEACNATMRYQRQS